MKTMKSTVELIPEEEGGYSVFCPELSVYSQGDTEAEAMDNIREAVELHLEELGSGVKTRPIIRREIEVPAGV